MAKFRKKPVVVEARRYEVESDGRALIDWINEHSDERTAYWRDTPNVWGPASIMIPTLEGDMEAAFGDWIIEGVNGEFYPCKPDIFSKTYDPVKEGK